MEIDQVVLTQSGAFRALDWSVFSLLSLNIRQSPPILERTETNRYTSCLSNVGDNNGRRFR